MYKARLLSLFTWHSMYRGSNEVITNVIAFNSLSRTLGKKLPLIHEDPAHCFADVGDWKFLHCLSNKVGDLISILTQL